MSVSVVDIKQNTMFGYLKNRLIARLSYELKNESIQIVQPDLDKLRSPLQQFTLEQAFTEDEFTLLLLALIPHIFPNFLNDIISDFLPKGGEFPEFGGVKGKNHRGILPTGETVQYILAGNDLEKRIEVTELFNEDHIFAKKGILYLDSVPKGEPVMSGQLILEPEFVELLTTGTVLKPKMSSDFPAQRIETDLVWEDLILNKKTLQQIKEIETWLKYNHILLNDWNMKSRIKPGYRVMFHGPPGTGKTLTANLLGKYTERDVYRIDLSLVVSKYIGETEKNLSKLFDKAKSKDWILFFDEADAIFGKRTNVRDAHDKYANQEVSYLLQRIEAHPGLVILASNFKSNIDTAFTRRFQSMIEFELPTSMERLALWKNNLPRKITVEKSIDLDELAKKYEITGANIVNVIQYACLKTISENNKSILKSHLLEGIKKEYQKEGKSLQL
ncbi:ATP-binding protein [Hwangdonia lutea]|uniref:ATP-binding protein n=1 Tax=Hwangdonia lutea TaxID=3075823 RepID=A0AA97EK10_9FLAO|nr:ATP-binding protein [Hwangdonia sp. SCSIO 19198]WOD42849.1 ATP-binding protein [Hwangdonia sp. SCSIO 19198]